MKQYNIYPTLLDSFTNYLNSSVIYQQFWGSSEAPTLTEEEYERQAFQDLINRINRVPFESEAADKVLPSMRYRLHSWGTQEY